MCLIFLNFFPSISGAVAGNDDVGVPSPVDLINSIISQILCSVQSHIEVGDFPLIRINDLLRRAPRARKPCSTSQASDNKAQTRHSSSNGMYPLGVMDREESENVLKQLVKIMTCIDSFLKEQMSAALTVKGSYDSKLRASAFMSVKLEVVKKDLEKKRIIFSNFRLDNTSRDDKFTADGCLLGDSAAESRTEIQTAHRTIADLDHVKGVETLPVSRYIENVFLNVLDVKRTDDCKTVSQVDVVKEILKACYSAHLIYTAHGDLRTSPGECEAVSVLLVETIIHELYNKLDELARTRAKELDKGTIFPYLYSRIYTIPDPLGPYYSDVVLRARYLSDSVRSGSMTSSKYNKMSSASSQISNKDDAFREENIQFDHEASSVFGEVESENESKSVCDRKIQDRVAAWRKEVKVSSTAHNNETTGKTPLKKETKAGPKLCLRGHHIDLQASSSGGLQKVVLSTESEDGGKAEEEYSEKKQKMIKDRNQGLGNGQSRSVNKTAVKKPPKLKVALFSSLERKESVGKKSESPAKQETNMIISRQRNKIGPAKSTPSMIYRKASETAPRRRMKYFGTHGSTRRNNEISYKITNQWPRTVHIVHHVSTDKPDQSNSSNTAGEPKTPVGLLRDSADRPDQSKSSCDQNKPQHDEIPPAKLEDTKYPTSPYITQLLISLMANEMPRETAVITHCFDEDAIAKLDIDDLCGTFTVIDLAMTELGQDDTAEAERLLRGEGRKIKVSQRAAGAVNSLLRLLST